MMRSQYIQQLPPATPGPAQPLPNGQQLNGQFTPSQFPFLSTPPFISELKPKIYINMRAFECGGKEKTISECICYYAFV